MRIGSRMNLVVTSSTSAGMVAESSTTWQQTTLLEHEQKQFILFWVNSENTSEGFCIYRISATGNREDFISITVENKLSIWYVMSCFNYSSTWAAWTQSLGNMMLVFFSMTWCTRFSLNSFQWKRTFDWKSHLCCFQFIRQNVSSLETTWFYFFL